MGLLLVSSSTKVASDLKSRQATHGQTKCTALSFTLHFSSSELRNVLIMSCTDWMALNSSFSLRIFSSNCPLRQPSANLHRSQVSPRLDQNMHELRSDFSEPRRQPWANPLSRRFPQHFCVEHSLRLLLTRDQERQRVSFLLVFHEHVVQVCLRHELFHLGRLPAFLVSSSVRDAMPTPAPE